MPFWALAYCGLILWSGIGCLQEAKKGRRPNWFAWIDMLAAVAWILIVVTYYVPVVAEGIGKGVILLFGLPLLWTIGSSPFEIAQLERIVAQLGRAGQVASWLAVLLAALFSAPAIALGFLAIRRVL